MISIVKDPSLLREGIVTALTDNFKNYKYRTYNSQDGKKLLNEQDLSELFIIDLDVNLDIINTIELLLKNKKKVIVWTSSLNNLLLIELFKLNLDGYFYNGMEKEELLSAISDILKGRKYIHKDLAPLLLGDYVRINNRTSNRPNEILSTREWEILELLTKGCKNEQISEILFLGEKTIKSYISSILKKLNVPDRTNAVIVAFRNKWFYV